VVDSFYFCVTTLTTVGFGDLTPTTVLSKLFTVVYILTGISIILGFIDVVARETRRRRIGRDGDGEGREEDGTAS
jgi:voltage-gated potassium channel